MNVIIQHNQSLFDIAIQEYGSIAAVFDLALINELSVTDELTTGAKLLLPEVSEDKINIEVRDYYKKHNIHPVTGDTVVGETIIPNPADGGCGWANIQW